MANPAVENALLFFLFFAGAASHQIFPFCPLPNNVIPSRPASRMKNKTTNFAIGKSDDLVHARCRMLDDLFFNHHSAIIIFDSSCAISSIT